MPPSNETKQGLTPEEESLLASQDPEAIFSYIHDHRLWNGVESVSGPGSDPQQTVTLRAELPLLLERHGITSILDVPCGDFLWMREALHPQINYTGGDIVKALVAANRIYETSNIRFDRIDLLNGPLPDADLLICRDCLVHLSFEHIAQALSQIARSKIRYLLVSNFLDCAENQDIPTGLWRPLNMEAPPFNFPSPIDLIVESCSEVDGKYRDKALALWRISDLKDLATATR